MFSSSFAYILEIGILESVIEEKNRTLNGIVVFDWSDCCK